MGLQDCQILLDNPWNTYYSGQTINGQVKLHLNSPKKIRGKMNSFLNIQITKASAFISTYLSIYLYICNVCIFVFVEFYSKVRKKLNLKKRSNIQIEIMSFWIVMFFSTDSVDLIADNDCYILVLFNVNVNEMNCWCFVCIPLYSVYCLRCPYHRLYKFISYRLDAH